MKTLPTFLTPNGRLVGPAAIAAWKNQRARCACGDYGCEESSIAGTSADVSAEWLGCPNCSGKALGKPLTFRSAKEIAVEKSSATVEAGITALLSNDIAVQDQFCKIYLTKKGRSIFIEAEKFKSMIDVRREVTRAVEAGY